MKIYSFRARINKKNFFLKFSLWQNYQQFEKEIFQRFFLSRKMKSINYLNLNEGNFIQVFNLDLIKRLLLVKKIVIQPQLIKRYLVKQNFLKFLSKCRCNCKSLWLFLVGSFSWIITLEVKNKFLFWCS